MAGARDQDWAAQLAAAQAWWRGAGVEDTFTDVPRRWLEPAAATPAVPVAPPAGQPPGAPARSEVKSAIGGDRSRWPSELAGFGDWWLTEPSLDPVPGGRRVLPSGPATAPLMVVVGHPEATDREALLEGAQGRLLDAILAAFGLSRPQVYLASALPGHAPHADWAALARDGAGEVLAHHVELVAPARLLVFGRGSVSALIGHDPAQAADPCLKFATARGSIPLALAPTLAAMLERPTLKVGVWMRWLEWTGVR